MKINVDYANPKVATFIIKDPIDGTTDLVGLNAEGNEVKGILKIASTYSKAFSDAAKKLTRENPSLIDGDSEEDITSRQKLIAACIVGWEDNGFFDKPCSLENAIELVKNPEYNWITNEQLFPFIHNKLNFFTKRSAS
jgi:hypothetical protein